MSDEVKLTLEEIDYVKRPLTDGELTATDSMPPFIAEGWIRRKRAQELAERRGDKHSKRLHAAFEAFAEALTQERESRTP